MHSLQLVLSPHALALRCPVLLQRMVLRGGPVRYCGRGTDVGDGAISTSNVVLTECMCYQDLVGYYERAIQHLPDHDDGTVRYLPTRVLRYAWYWRRIWTDAKPGTDELHTSCGTV